MDGRILLVLAIAVASATAHPTLRRGDDARVLAPAELAGAMRFKGESTPAVANAAAAAAAAAPGTPATATAPKLREMTKEEKTRANPLFLKDVSLKLITDVAAETLKLKLNAPVEWYAMPVKGKGPMKASWANHMLSLGYEGLVVDVGSSKMKREGEGDEAAGTKAITGTPGTPAASAPEQPAPSPVFSISVQHFGKNQYKAGESYERNVQELQDRMPRVLEFVAKALEATTPSDDAFMKKYAKLEGAGPFKVGVSALRALAQSPAAPAVAVSAPASAAAAPGAALAPAPGAAPAPAGAPCTPTSCPSPTTEFCDTLEKPPTCVAKADKCPSITKALTLTEADKAKAKDDFKIRDADLTTVPLLQAAAYTKLKNFVDRIYVERGPKKLLEKTLVATAGLRESFPNKQQVSVDEVLRSGSNKMKAQYEADTGRHAAYKQIMIKVLTGQEEAAYEYADVKRLLKESQVVVDDAGHWVIMMSMGGSSTQITVEKNGAPCTKVSVILCENLARAVSAEANDLSIWDAHTATFKKFVKASVTAAPAPAPATTTAPATAAAPAPVKAAAPASAAAAAPAAVSKTS